MHYQVYGGNKHDSKVFKQMADEMFGVICDFNKTQQKLTIVFDKGMNSEDNIGFIDDHSRIHFITTYSPYFVEEIAETDLKHFTPVNTRRNLKLEEHKKAHDRLLTYRTKLTLRGKERTIIVTHNPVAARKKQYILHKKLDTLYESLLEFQENYRKNKPHWRKQDEINRRYEKLCKQLHISSLYYQLEFHEQRDNREISFQKSSEQIKKSESSFGRNIIVTDHHDWTSDEIVQLSLDRYFVEKQFRASNDTQHINLKPFYHWTDGKIRCHLLTCVIAMTIMRLLEIKVEKNQIRTSLNSNSGPAIIEEMRSLNTILSWYPGSRKAERSFEQPDMIQAEILKVFGWEIKQGGVLQKIAI